jgi:hypothetical protein
MTSSALENLAKIRKLKAEPSSPREFDGLMRSAVERATDACNASLALASRFTLAYDASHSLALAALRAHGYRSEDRYLVFQCLAQTLGWAGRRINGVCSIIATKSATWLNMKVIWMSTMP